MNLRRIVITAAMLLLTGCGSSGPSFTVNFTNGASIDATHNPFTDPAVIDVIFVLNNVVPAANVVDASGKVLIPAGTRLDKNNDNQPDTLFFPTNCTQSLPAACGFPPGSANFNLSDVPLGFQFTLTARFRNSTGSSLYSGTSAAFSNVESGVSGPITLTLDVE